MHFFLDPTSVFCLLPHNIMSENIYIFLWFWLIFLAVVTFIYLIYEVVMVFHFGCRYSEVEEQNFGFQFIIHMLEKYLDEYAFGELLTELKKTE